TARSSNSAAGWVVLAAAGVPTTPGVGTASAVGATAAPGAVVLAAAAAAGGLVGLAVAATVGGGGTGALGPHAATIRNNAASGARRTIADCTFIESPPGKLPP